MSFKWVINRSLPIVCYTTSLDLYSIVGIFFICLVFSWHSVVGAFYSSNPSYFQMIDKWMLLAFSCLFLLIQGFFVLNSLKSYLKVRQIQKKSQKYFKEL